MNDIDEMERAARWFWAWVSVLVVAIIGGCWLAVIVARHLPR